jgi:3-oxoacyl-[acyl-carrier protein] reductase
MQCGAKMKTVLITGGNKGIGLETTRLFLSANYRVVILARDFEKFEFKNNGNVECINFNLLDTHEIPNVILGIGAIDVLINNAGIMLSLPYNGYASEDISNIIKVNLEAPIALINAVSETMITNKSGRIVNNASIAGQIGHPDIWYGVTKAGLINATKSYAKILGQHGILVNAVAASPTDTEMLATIPETRKSDFKKSVILNRFAKPEEVAESIFWLGSNSPEYINGICLDINNGSFNR